MKFDVGNEVTNNFKEYIDTFFYDKTVYDKFFFFFHLQTVITHSDHNASECVLLQSRMYMTS